MWTLHLHPSVIQYLYSLRETGQPLRERLQTLQRESEPWVDTALNPTLADTYEVEVAGHWVGFRVNKQEKILSVLYIQLN